MHIFLKGFIAVKFCNKQKQKVRKKEKKRIKSVALLRSKRNAIFIEITIFILNFRKGTSVIPRSDNLMILTH